MYYLSSMKHLWQHIEREMVFNYFRFLGIYLLVPYNLMRISPMEKQKALLDSICRLASRSWYAH